VDAADLPVDDVPLVLAINFYPLVKFKHLTL